MFDVEWRARAPIYFLNVLQDIKSHLVPTLKELGLKPKYEYVDGDLLVRFRSEDQRWENAVSVNIEGPRGPDDERASWGRCAVEISNFGYAQVGDNGWKCVGFSFPRFVRPKRGEPQAVLKAIANRIRGAELAPISEELPIVWNIPLQRAYFAMKQVLPETTSLNVERRTISDGRSEEGLSFVDGSGAEMWLAIDCPTTGIEMAKLYREGALVDEREACSGILAHGPP